MAGERPDPVPDSLQGRRHGLATVKSIVLLHPQHQARPNRVLMRPSPITTGFRRRPRNVWYGFGRFGRMAVVNAAAGIVSYLAEHQKARGPIFARRLGVVSRRRKARPRLAPIVRAFGRPLEFAAIATSAAASRRHNRRYPSRNGIRRPAAACAPAAPPFRPGQSGVSNAGVSARVGMNEVDPRQGRVRAAIDQAAASSKCRRILGRPSFSIAASALAMPLTKGSTPMKAGVGLLPRLGDHRTSPPPKPISS